MREFAHIMFNSETSIDIVCIVWSFQYGCYALPLHRKSRWMSIVATLSRDRKDVHVIVIKTL